MFFKKVVYLFLHKKCLASLFLSKYNENYTYLFNGFKALTLSINTLKLYDSNLLIINALCFLLLGQYPKILMDKSLIKYRKSKITFILTFSKKYSLYIFLKLFYLTLARQLNFQGYFFKTNYFVTYHNHWTFPIKTLYSFFMIDFLYGQQHKSILTVKQKLTINIDCSFLVPSHKTNAEYIYLLSIPFLVDTLFTKKEVELKQELDK